MKTLRNPDGAFQAMKKAIDKLADAIPTSAPATVKAQLHSLKRPGSTSGQLKVAIDAYNNPPTHPSVKKAGFCI
jgi:hypothetical protein